MSLPPTTKRRVAIALSGGIDSSVAASLLIDQGYEVIGLTANLWQDESSSSAVEKTSRSSQVAEFLGIPHITIHLTDTFIRTIVNPFLTEYSKGRTPSPCIRCNQLIKFGLLLNHAVKMKCSHVAYGHYARVEKQADQWHLLKGADARKDQSYFLHRLNQKQLARTLFPLGSWRKNDVKMYIKTRGIPAQNNTESQDLCFTKNSDYAALLEKRFPELNKPGPIIDMQSRQLGCHHGFYHYTIGQREGLGIASSARLYVTAIDAVSNTVTVGSRENTMSQSGIVDDVNWISAVPSDGMVCHTKLRYRHEGVISTLHFLSEGAIKVKFHTPQFAVTQGQAAVFYKGNDVIGGGWLRSAQP